MACIWLQEQAPTVQGSPGMVPMEIMSPTSKGCTTKRKMTHSNSVLNMLPKTNVKDSSMLPTVTQMCWKFTCHGAAPLRQADLHCTVLAHCIDTQTHLVGELHMILA